MPSVNFEKEAAVAGVKVISADHDFEHLSEDAEAEIKRACQRLAKRSRDQPDCIFILSRSATTEMIYWNMPMNSLSDDERKAAAEIWSKCIFVGGQTLFVTSDLTFPTLREAVPSMRAKIESRNLPE